MHRELLADSPVHLSSMESFSISQLIILVLWPATLLFWLSLTAPVGLFQQQQASVFSGNTLKNPPAQNQTADRHQVFYIFLNR